jgi:hypothetical protein
MSATMPLDRARRRRSRQAPRRCRRRGASGLAAPSALRRDLDLPRRHAQRHPHCLCSAGALQ